VLSYRLQSADENSQLRAQGLKRLYEDDNAKGVPSDSADRLRKMLAFLEAMQETDELRTLAAWKAHTLDRRPQRHVELKRYAQSPPDVLDR
jgi:plasmid maintenance system killer protein